MASLKSVAWYWFPALLWIAVVLAASFDMFSSQHTGMILMAIWKWVAGSVDARAFESVHFIIRKGAHFTEYAILSALWFRAARGGLAGIWRSRWTLAGLAAALLVSIADEWHQAFVPSRTSEATDVLIDLCGAACAQLLIYLLLERRQRRAAERPA